MYSEIGIIKLLKMPNFLVIFLNRRALFFYF